MDSAGKGVSSAGDLDGDGRDEVLIGAGGALACAENAGGVYVILEPEPGTLSLSSADATLCGDAGDHVGHSLAGAGDVDGDGLGDLLVGADQVGLDATGRAYLVTQVPMGIHDLSAIAEALMVGEADYDKAGHTVSGAGDVNGDGFDDVLIGAHENDENGDTAGAAYLLHGPFSGTIPLSQADVRFYGESDGDYAGWVGASGDVDGDGNLDLLVGALNDDTGVAGSGSVSLFYGPVSGIIDLSTADAKFHGENPGDMVAYPTAAGDLDGDGFDDLVIGAPGYDGTGGLRGAVYVVYGVGM